jgi:hypothetical protein
VQTVLGLSMTATSVGWVLLDGQGLNAATLDHDAFDVQASTDGDASDTSQHTAAARGAQAIATTSGHKVGSVRVTWTEDVEGAATTLLKSLADSGFDNVHAISLSKATEAWGIEIGRQNELTKSGLCILEPNAATVMIVATGAGSVRTAVTDTRETAEDLIDWLRTVFRTDGWMPERLYVLGALDDLDKVLEPIADALPIPVSDSADIQLALARGAALATVSQIDAGSSHAAGTPRERPWRLSRAKKSITPADADTVAVATVSQIDGDSSQAVETPHSELRVDTTQSDRPWLASHAKKVTIAAAAVAVFGAALSLAAGSAINVEETSAQAADPATEAVASTAEGASVTSPSAHTVPAPRRASPPPQVQPLAAPPPARPGPPKTLAPPAESVAALAPEPVALPQHTVSASPPADVPVTAPDTQPPAVPLAVPVAPQFVAPLGALPGPPPVAPLGALPGPPSVAPLGALPGPPPVAPVAVAPAPQQAAPFAAPAVAAPAPIAPPPMAPLAALPGPPPAAPLAAPPAPIAPPPPAAPAPSEPADAPPPPDPVQAVLSPLLFGALP